MKKRIIFTTIFWVNIIVLPQNLHAFENVKTHPAITGRAVTASTIDDYLKIQIGLNDGINAQLTYDFPSEIKKRIKKAQWLPDKKQRSVLEWLKVGSAIEDTDETWYLKPIRPRHHFLDPTRNAGLNDQNDHPEWRLYSPAWGTRFDFDFTGESALIWAINGTASHNPKTNEQSWQKSRAAFYHSLAETLKSDREKYLAMTFLDLGCVCHLLEDMGVPAHTRNDFLFAHYRKARNKDYGEPFEGWIEMKIPDDGSLSLSRWISPSWTPVPQVFVGVSNYFDTDTRTAGNYLGDGISPPDTWGLSEATNYQFFSWSTISPLSSTLYYFPHPDVELCGVRDESGRTYLYGYAVNHLAKFTMSEDFLQHGHLEQTWCTLGGAIYDNYAEISLPRTIDYATGLVELLFSGQT